MKPATIAFALAAAFFALISILFTWDMTLALLAANYWHAVYSLIYSWVAVICSGAFGVVSYLEWVKNAVVGGKNGGESR